MVIIAGDKVHVVARRKFEDEIRRHFVGEVLQAVGTAARIKGYAFIFDSSTNRFVKKPEIRTTIIDVAESGYIVNVIPTMVDIDALDYVVDENRHLTVTDGKKYHLDINEFGPNR